MKKVILTTVFALATLAIGSCDKKADKSNESESGHVHQEGEATHENDSTGSPHSKHDHKEGDSLSGHDHENEDK